MSDAGTVSLMMGGTVDDINLVDIMYASMNVSTTKLMSKAVKFAEDFTTGRMTITARFLNRAMIVRNRYLWKDLSDE
jgi:hypothetical protein